MTEKRTSPPMSISKFIEYHRAHEELKAAYDKRALQAVDFTRQKRGNWGSMAIIQILRWDTALAGLPPFKIVNDVSPYYARSFMRTYPEHRGFFRTQYRPETCDKGITQEEYKRRYCVDE
jgi:hypothetical protein